MKAKYILLILVCFNSLWAQAQVQFTNRNDLLGEQDLHSAVPVAIADMNGDGLDDIVALNVGTQLFVQYQTPDPNRPFVRYEIPTGVDVAEQNDIIVADFNNDGANDIFTVGSYDRVKIFYSIPNTYQFNLTYLEVTPFFSQGASAGDFNGDGWVDVVILNDNAANYSLINDGAGNLVVEDFFDFITVPASDNSGNYGSLYTDFDMDGDLDFYIAKCRQGVSNSNDPRRIDALFVNDGQNQYTQNAAAYGLADGHQTWTADFGDFDNDGDLDLFKTQHDVLCQLFENIDNDTFIDITPQTGLNIGGVPLQGIFRDFDNDGWQDILVSGDRVDFWHNDGDGTFTKQEPFGGAIFGTFVVGDLNHDGITDVYASTVIPFNNPDILREDMLFLGEKNGNHFLSLQLIDSSLNTSAIGAMALLYGKWGTQVREVRAGEQYGVSNSHTMIFGLGEESSYDSLVIRWPDGTRETYNNLSVDETWTLRRGGCYKLPQTKWPGFEVLCGNDSLILELTGLPVDKWSTGSTDESITIQESGLYYATYIDENNCLVRTVPVEVVQNPDSVKPEISYEGKTLLCHGDVAVLSLPQGISYHWSSGQTTQSIEATETGDYFASVQGFCLAQKSDTLSLEFHVPPVPVTEGDTFKLGEDAILHAVGDSIEWYYDADGVSKIGSGPVLTLIGLEANATVYARNLDPIDGLEYQVGPQEQQGSTKYNAAFVNGGLQFEVHEPIVLNEFTVYTDSVGPRIFEISNNGFFFDKQVDLEAGMTVITLDLELPVGAYTISTNTDLNTLVFHNNSPYLWRSDVGIDYPYEISGIFSINNSTFGSQYYYYFYDWKISTSEQYCGSDLVPVTAVFDPGTATEDIINDQAIVISPNPTNGLCRMKIKSSSSAEIELINTEGVELMQVKREISNEGDTIIDLTNYAAGVYIVRMIQDGHLFTRIIIRL